MRVTSNQLVRDQISALQTTASAMSRAQLQISSGRRITIASDDPVGARDVMAMDGRLRAITQYRRGLDAARSRIELQDNVTSQMSLIMTRAQELTVMASTDTITESARRGIAQEVEGLFTELVALGNTTVEGEFLFGGDRVTERPFAITGTGTTLDFTTTGAVGARQVEIDAGRTLVPTDDGATLFIDTGVLSTMRDLVRELAGPPTAGHAPLQQVGRNMSLAFDRVQERIGALGARAGTVELVSANLDAFEGSLQAFRSEIVDIDLERAAVELVSRQNAYQSALFASSKVLGLNLSDYLR